MMKTKKLGIYIHIPFCESKCNYCDFNSSNYKEETRNSYIKSLKIEIIRESKKYIDYEIDSIFIGGGTPSLLNSSEITEIVEILNSNFTISDDLEFTIEGNPNSLNLEKIKTYKDININRISIGAQSFIDTELFQLGRIHKKDDIYSAVENIKRVGIKNINIDLMMGIPYQSFESFSKSLEEAIKLDVEHISCYSLIVEDGTPFGEISKRGESLYIVDEDTERKMYLYLKKFLKDHNYNHYEISNFSKKGYKCKHNLKYWRCEDYLGLGLGSHSRIGNKRFFNESNIHNYIHKNCIDKTVIIEEETLEIKDQINEKIFMGLRLIDEGINISEIEKKYNFNFLEEYKNEIIKNEINGYIEIDRNNLKLTNKGMDFLNMVELDFYR